MEDLLEQANEIQESLGRSYAVPDELDEADLAAGTEKGGSKVRTARLTALIGRIGRSPAGGGRRRSLVLVGSE